MRFELLRWNFLCEITYLGSSYLFDPMSAFQLLFGRIYDDFDSLLQTVTKSFVDLYFFCFSLEILNWYPVVKLCTWILIGGLVLYKVCSGSIVARDNFYSLLKLLVLIEAPQVYFSVFITSWDNERNNVYYFL